MPAQRLLNVHPCGVRHTRWGRRWRRHWRDWTANSAVSGRRSSSATGRTTESRLGVPSQGNTAAHGRGETEEKRRNRGEAEKPRRSGETEEKRRNRGEAEKPRRSGLASVLVLPRPLQRTGCHIDDIPLEVDVTRTPQEGKQRHIHRHWKAVDGTSSPLRWPCVMAGPRHSRHSMGDLSPIWSFVPRRPSCSKHLTGSVGRVPRRPSFNKH